MHTCRPSVSLSSAPRISCTPVPLSVCRMCFFLSAHCRDVHSRLLATACFGSLEHPPALFVDKVGQRSLPNQRAGPARIVPLLGEPAHYAL